MLKTIIKEPVKPILRWAGGKQNIIKILVSLLPDDIDFRRYREPFLGAGSLFLSILPKKSILSDANEHLIKCFQFVRDNPELVSKYLNIHKNNDCKKYYYKIRDKYNNSIFSATQAARFIYLNKACYNGIFRVNQKNEFNVPYGNKKNICIPTGKELILISQALKNAKIGASAIFLDSKLDMLS